jgi:hypothetical protein
MRVSERPRDFEHELRRGVRGEASAATHAIGQRFTIDICHDEKQNRTVFLDRVNRNDVGMHQLRSGASLAQESFANGRIGREMGRQQFDRDLSLQGDVTREENYSHSPAAEFPVERITAGDCRLQCEEFWISQTVALCAHRRVRRVHAHTIGVLSQFG